MITSKYTISKRIIKEKYIKKVCLVFAIIMAIYTPLQANNNQFDAMPKYVGLEAFRAKYLPKYQISNNYSLVDKYGVEVTFLPYSFYIRIKNTEEEHILQLSNILINIATKNGLENIGIAESDFERIIDVVKSMEMKPEEVLSDDSADEFADANTSNVFKPLAVQMQKSKQKKEIESEPATIKLPEIIQDSAKNEVKPKSNDYIILTPNLKIADNNQKTKAKITDKKNDNVPPYYYFVPTGLVRRGIE